MIEIKVLRFTHVLSKALSLKYVQLITCQLELSKAAKNTFSHEMFAI